MPELPEVEHVKRGLERKLEHERIIDVRFSDKVIEGKNNNKATIIKGTSLDEFKDLVVNQTIHSIQRRSKYLIFELDEGYIVGHLGMSGAYFVVSSIEEIEVQNYQKHWHVQLILESGKCLVYSDIRRFGEMRFVDALENSPIKDIAPEPFEEEALAHYLHQLESKRWQDKPIKEAIMHHSVVSGCGNIYACEALFNSGIAPGRKVKMLSRTRRIKLFNEIVEVLNQGIIHGGSSISSYRNVEGQTGAMQHRHRIYNKKICPTCHSVVKTKVIAGRNTHYCSNCQK